MCASSFLISLLFLKEEVTLPVAFLSHFRLRNPNIKPPQFQTCRNLNSYCVFTGPASPISSQLKHSTGYSEGKWWMHQFWGYP